MRRIWEGKPVLSRVYSVWFDALLASLPPQPRVVEVGAGPGFLSSHARRRVPGLAWVATEVPAHRVLGIVEMDSTVEKDRT